MHHRSCGGSSRDRGRGGRGRETVLERVVCNPLGKEIGVPVVVVAHGGGRREERQYNTVKGKFKRCDNVRWSWGIEPANNARISNLSNGKRLKAYNSVQFSHPSKFLCSWKLENFVEFSTKFWICPKHLPGNSGFIVDQFREREGFKAVNPNHNWFGKHRLFSVSFTACRAPT